MTQSERYLGYETKTTKGLSRKNFLNEVTKLLLECDNLEPDARKAVLGTILKKYNGIVATSSWQVEELRNYGAAYVRRCDETGNQLRKLQDSSSKHDGIIKVLREGFIKSGQGATYRLSEISAVGIDTEKKPYIATSGKFILIDRDMYDILRVIMP